jgi:hypothetical protein
MKSITRLGLIAAVFTLFSTLALGAPKTERESKYFKVAGKVIQIDKKDRTLLVTDRLSKKLYLIQVPEWATFKITFGRYLRMAEPTFEDVRAGERIEIRCIRNDNEHLALVDDGSTATRLTAGR